MDKYLPCRRRPTILRRTRFCREWLHPLEFHSAENLSTFLVELRLSWSPKNKIHDHLGKRGNASEKTGRLARHSRTHLVSHQPYQTVLLSPLEYKTGNVWTGIRYLATLKEFSARANILLVSGLTWCYHQKLGLHKMHHSLCCNTRRFWTYQAIYVGQIQLANLFCPHLGLITWLVVTKNVWLIGVCSDVW